MHVFDLDREDPSRYWLEVWVEVDGRFVAAFQTDGDLLTFEHDSEMCIRSDRWWLAADVEVTT